jgi:hypothetical protein
MSVPPPGAAGTMMRTGFTGYGAAAQARPALMQKPATDKNTAARLVIGQFIRISSVY